MIDKTIGVIPPRNELSSFSDKRAENSKDKKSEFESYFKQLTKNDLNTRPGGIKKKAIDTDAKLARETEKKQKPELKNDEKDEKVADKKKNKLENQEMTLNHMVSQENVTKVPDTEVNLVSLEENSLVEIKSENAESLKFNSQELGVELMPESQLESEIQADSDMTIDEALVAAEVTAEVVSDSSPEILSEAQTDAINKNNVLETLSREQLFQKLENMTKSDLNVESKDQEISDRLGTTEFSTGLNNSEKKLTQSDDNNKDSDSSLEHSSQELSHHLGSKTGSETKDFAATLSGANKTESGAPVEKNESSNLKDILNEARYLVTKGGGEVSVKMSPEGMGEVHLKMMLLNGKMNLEMMTEDKNVQKMIQESLSDLKSSLAAHQISVEHVTLNNKINFVQDMQKSADANSSSDSGRHAQAGENSFTNFHNNENSKRQQHSSNEKSRNNFFENSENLPVISNLNDVKKAVAHKVYQSHKAQSLNAVA